MTLRHYPTCPGLPLGAKAPLLLLPLLEIYEINSRSDKRNNNIKKKWESRTGDKNKIKT
jgi:hypothetical protein